MATIKDVAREAGVSISTVSHVVNKTRYVSPDTTGRVEAAMESLNYSPSAIARSLKKSRTDTIGMIISSSSNPFFAEVLRGVEDNCFRLGYNLILCNSDDNNEKQAAYLKNLVEKRIDGLIIMPAQHEQVVYELIDQYQLPKVVLDCKVGSCKGDLIYDDSEYGAYCATRYLIKKGHRKIGAITGWADTSPSIERLAGFRAAMGEAGLPVQEEWLIEGHLESHGGYQAVQRLLTLNERPTALFAFNDLSAMGAACAAREAGLIVPDHLSIVGYDDIELARYFWPPLTTIRQPKYRLGRMAAETLVNRLRDPDRPPCRLVLENELIERGSVAPPA